MRLDQLFKNIIPTEITDAVEGISYDPLRCKKNFIYVAINIYTQLDGIEVPDGHDGINLAIENGAKWIIGDMERPIEVSAPVFYVKSPRLALAQISKRFFKKNEIFETIGVIGTNGKTSVSYLLYQLLNSKKSAAYLGTIGSFIKSDPYPSKDTTPEPVDLWLYRQELSKRVIDYSVMEVSSHGICFERVYGLDFDRLIFTNITPDHLDYHETFENYLNAKLKPFRGIQNEKIALINMDVKHSDKFIKACSGKVLTYGISERADLKANSIEYTQEGVQFNLNYKNNSVGINAPLLGKHNLENILAVSSCALTLGYELNDLEAFWPNCRQIPGRLEKIEYNGITAIIDYAHTEDAMRQVLNSLKPFCGGSLRVVFGCGGDRDRTKRALMGSVACEFASKVYLTQDNPRYEDPEQICTDILMGCKEEMVELIHDRRTAIEKALEDSKDGDWVVVLGKGHETKQVVKGKVLPFDEREIIQTYLKKSYLTFSQPENL